MSSNSSNETLHLVVLLLNYYANQVLSNLDSDVNLRLNWWNWKQEWVSQAQKILGFLQMKWVCSNEDRELQVEKGWLERNAQ